MLSAVCHLITYIYQSIKLVFCKQPCPVAFTRELWIAIHRANQIVDCGNNMASCIADKERACVVGVDAIVVTIIYCCPHKISDLRNTIGG